MSLNLLVFHSFEGVEAQAFLEIYQESSKDNAVRWYPDLSEGEALAQYESGFLRFMQTAFFGEGGTLFILESDGVYVSALRLIETAPAQYYLEALETHPQHRRCGYGKALLTQLLSFLKEQQTHFSVTAHIEKTNAASLHTHRTAGFTITADFVTEDGERFDGDYELTYSI